MGARGPSGGARRAPAKPPCARQLDLPTRLLALGDARRVHGLAVPHEPDLHRFIFGATCHLSDRLRRHDPPNRPRLSTSRTGVTLIGGGEATRAFGGDTTRSFLRLERRRRPPARASTSATMRRAPAAWARAAGRRRRRRAGPARRAAVSSASAAGCRGRGTREGQHHWFWKGSPASRRLSCAARAGAIDPTAKSILRPARARYLTAKRFDPRR